MVDDTKARQTAQQTKDKVLEEAKRTGETVSREARAVADEAASVGRAHADQRFEQGKGALEGQVDTIHSAVDGAARRLHEENSPLASYADELSGQLSRFSSGIQNSSLDDIAMKTRRVARENPALFVLGSVVAGIAAGRFFKASSSRDHSDHRDLPDYRTDRLESDDYHAGRQAAMARYRNDLDYRSPVARTETSYRPSPGGSAGTVSDTAGRVPMDSSLARDTPSSSPTTGGTGTTAPASTTGTATTTAGAGNTTGGQ